MMIRNVNNTVDNTVQRRRLIDHRGIFREIQEFKLVRKLNPIKGYHIETERDGVRNILEISSLHKKRQGRPLKEQGLHHLLQTKARRDKRLYFSAVTTVTTHQRKTMKMMKYCEKLTIIVKQ